MMADEGFDLLPGEHPIVAVMFPDPAAAVTIAEAMLRAGVYVVAFSYPVVPRDASRIRVQLTSAHSAEDIRRCVEAFVAARREVLGELS